MICRVWWIMSDCLGCCCRGWRNRRISLLLGWIRIPRNSSILALSKISYELMPNSSSWPPTWSPTNWPWHYNKYVAILTTYHITQYEHNHHPHPMVWNYIDKLLCLGGLAINMMGYHVILGIECVIVIRSFRGWATWIGCLRGGLGMGWGMLECICGVLAWIGEGSSWVLCSVSRRMAVSYQIIKPCNQPIYQSH